MSRSCATRIGCSGPAVTTWSTLVRNDSTCWRPSPVQSSSTATNGASSTSMRPRSAGVCSQQAAVLLAPQHAGEQADQFLAVDRACRDTARCRRGGSGTAGRRIRPARAAGRGADRSATRHAALADGPATCRGGKVDGRAQPAFVHVSVSSAGSVTSLHTRDIGSIPPSAKEPI